MITFPFCKIKHNSGFITYEILLGILEISDNSNNIDSLKKAIVSNNFNTTKPQSEANGGLRFIKKIVFQYNTWT